MAAGFSKAWIDRRCRARLGTVAGILLAMALGTPPLIAAELTTLHRFTGSDGAAPSAGLLVDQDGTLYGTTFQAGKAGFGTVFKLVPPGPGESRWKRTVLTYFGGYPDGGYLEGRLIFGSDGALYGTTSSGGSWDLGTVFKLTPPNPGNNHWKKTIIHSFKGGRDGTRPGAGLISGADGSLYGTAGNVIFNLTPVPGQKRWQETILHRTSFSEGQFLIGELISDQHGGFYGAANEGGLGDLCSSGCGTVFRLTPPTPDKLDWTFEVLHRFAGPPSSGSYPINLLLGQNGELFGTTNAGGTYDKGTVFKLTPPGPDQTLWTESVLHSFNGDDGDQLFAGLLQGGDGALYGATTYGGRAVCNQSGCGTVFKLTPPASGHTRWRRATLHRFAHNGRGYFPSGTLAAGADGVLFGTTIGGGRGTLDDCGDPLGCGTVFKLIP